MDGYTVYVARTREILSYENNLMGFFYSSKSTYVDINSHFKWITSLQIKKPQTWFEHNGSFRHTKEGGQNITPVLIGGSK